MIIKNALVRLFFCLFVALLVLPDANAQSTPSLDDLRRRGVNINDPNAILQAARQMGWTDAQIQQVLTQRQSSANTPAPDTTTAPQGPVMSPEQARAEAQRYGLDLSDPEAAMRRARSLGLPIERVQRMLRAVGQSETADRSGQGRGGSGAELLQMPQISPASIELEGHPATVTVLVTLDGPVDRVQLHLINPTETDTLSARRVERVAVGRRASQVPDSTRRGMEDPVGGADGSETWFGTIMVPPTVESGVWTLAVVAGRRLIAPAGVVRIRGEAKEETLHYFGHNTFRNVPEAFRPGAMGPAGDGYVVGPQDELRLTVWGAAEFQYDLPVDPEGRIYVPRVGQLTVAGKTISDLRRDIRIWLSRSYAGLVDEPPSVMMDVTVTRLRPLDIFVLGEVEQPGGYQIPSGSNIFNALYSVGGPLPRGSLRKVRIIRGDRVAELDLYDYLLRGYKSDAMQLQTGDNVFIPPRGKTVSISGAVKRPAIYEMKDGESFDDLLNFAGGLKAEAYTRRFQIERIIPFAKRTDPTHARTVLDSNLGDVLSGASQVQLEDGDRVRIFSINEAEDLAVKSTIPAVYAEGAVFKPGRYELGPSLNTVRDLIEQADGLTGAAFLEKAELIRLGPDLESEILSIDLTKVMEDVPTHNLVLRPQDSLRVYSYLAMRGDRKVMIAGQVQRPGEYDYYEGMTVLDLLYRGEGLRDGEYLKGVFLERADLFRVSPDGSTERIIPFDLAAALNGSGMANERLLPQDEIRIYPAEVNELRERWVAISGAVKEPGEYRYRDGMSIEDLILQAGGFTEDAYKEQVEVTRAIVNLDSRERARQIRVPLPDAFSFADLRQRRQHQLASRGGAMSDLLAVEDSSTSDLTTNNFELQHRDRVYVRAIPDFKEQETVLLTGEVRFPGEYTLLHENETLSSILRRAGGPLPSGYPRGGKLMREGEPVIVEIDKAVAGRRGADVIMMPGDSIHIPLQPNTVAVQGNVANEGLIKYAPGQRVSYYIDRAGGLQEDTEAVLLTQASGATYKLKRHLFGVLPRQNPIVDDGATISVTVEPPTERGPFELQDITDRLTDVTAILSTTVTLLVLSRELSK